MASFRTLLFDLDGTLIDHFKAIHRCYTYTLPRVGVPAPTPLQVRNAVGGGLENAIAKFVPADRLAEAIAIYRAYWHETMLQDVEALPGAREILKASHARGAACGVLTNKLGSSSRLICDKLGFTPYLKAVIGAGDTAWLKPQAELTAYALAQVGGSPDSALLVGDSPYDVQAGHNGGFSSWVVTTGTHSAEELAHAKADRIFPDLTTLGQALLATA
jgi:phosphoglycolate phosphatase-like HAD superfamily hydrolase